MLSVSGMSKSYGSTVVLTDVDASVPAHGTTFLMGPNGAGKTTFIRCLLGLESHSGDVRWNGVPFMGASDLVFPVFEDTPFYRKLTGLQNLRLLAPVSLGGSRQYLSRDVLRRKVGTYSHGQRMRLALTAALNSGAALVILDEPTNGLDVETARRLRADMVELGQETAFLVTGHHLDFYDGLVDHLLVLKEGKILTSASDNEQSDGRGDLAQTYDRHFPGASE